MKSSKKSDREYRNSGILTEGGPQLIKNQHLIYDVNQHKLKEIKNGIKCQKSKQYQNTLTKIKQTLENDISPLKFLESSYKTSNLQLVDYHSTNETWFLSWQDNVMGQHSDSLQWHTTIKFLASRRVCGQIFNLEHSISCKTEGFTTLRRHNELGDFTVNQLSEVCHDVRLKPQLKPLTGEIYHYSTSNTVEDAKFDVSARGFWVRGQLAFSDIWALYPLAKCYNAKHLKSIFAAHEREKKRSYNQRIIETEMAPLLC